MFFHDGDGDQIDIKYSRDNGGTWNTISSLSYDTNDFSVWWKSISGTERIWIAINDSGDIKVASGTLGITSITWDSSGATDTVFSTNYAYPYISLDSGNYLWVGARVILTFPLIQETTSGWEQEFKVVAIMLMRL
jgi:hypothetical protein